MELDDYGFVLPGFCNVDDDLDFLAAAKFLKLIERGRVALRRGKNTNSQRTTSNGAITGGYHPGKDEICSQDKEDSNKERSQNCSQNSNTENTPIQSTGEMYVLSWGAEPLKRLPGKDLNSPNEFFSKNTLNQVKLRAGFKMGNLTKSVILRSNKKRITPKVANEEKETGNEKKKKKK